MEATGCATGVAICACSPVRHRRDRPQVLPAYGLQDLRNKSRNLKTKSNANTTCLQNTLGEDHGSGHFYLAENRTFLLCVDKPAPTINGSASRAIGLYAICPFRKGTAPGQRSDGHTRHTSLQIGNTSTPPPCGTWPRAQGISRRNR